MRIEPVALGFVCGYELASLIAHSDRLPTITQMVSRLPRKYRRIVSLMSAVWVLLHFDDETAGWFYRAFTGPSRRT